MHPYSFKGILEKKYGIFNLIVHLQNLDTMAHYGDQRIPLIKECTFEFH
jgi:hypothetical protein